MRNKSSVFAESALKCMVSLPPFPFRIPRLGALMLLNTGWPVSLKRPTISVAMESTFRQVCSSEFRITSFHHLGLGMSSVLARISPAKFLTCSDFGLHFSEFPLFDQSMSLNIDMKTNRSSNFSGSMFWSCKFFGVFWTISNEVRPGKIFHSNTICSPSTPNNSLYNWTVESFRVDFPSGVCF